MATQSYVFGSGVTNIKGVNSFEIGNTYSQYDIVFFSGYTVAGTPPVPTTAESLGTASGTTTTVALQPPLLLLRILQREPLASGLKNYFLNRLIPLQ